MTTAQLIPLRTARDRLLELLGLGEPYPLQDLPLGNQTLMVALNIPAQIEITQSQPDVLYQLYFEGALVGRGQSSGAWLKRGDNGHWLQRTPERTWRTRTGQEESDDAGQALEGQGTGSTLTLETYRVQEDITFAIRATKLTSRRATTLHATATVKVGLNLHLAAQIVDGEPLDPAQTDPTAARIIDYGQGVKVAIHNSQEGVDYHLVTQAGKQEIIVSTAPARGNLHTIELQSQPFTEDSELRIRATKTFEAAEKRDPQSDLLAVVLPLKVRANPAVAVQADPIIDYGGQAQLTLRATQASVTYQLFRHTLADSEYVRQPFPPGDVIAVAVPEAAAVQVRPPARLPTWSDPAGYAPVGEPQPGNGSDLTFRLPALTDDSLIIIRASKTHQATETIPSAVQLAAAALILVRPNPVPELRLQVQMAETATRGDVQFWAGQPGVFYQVRRSATGEEIGLPAYFHQRDGQDPAVNKGLGQLAVEVDLVVARALPPEQETAELAAIPPPAPSVATGPLPLDTPLAIQAIKAQTRVSALLAAPLRLPTGPAVAPAKTEVAAGASTTIRIVDSQRKEWYQLLLAGQPVGEEVEGNGQNRLLPTGALTADSPFVLRITQRDPALVVERFVELSVIKVTPPVDPVSVSVQQ